jgi:hypothetical protein
VSSAPFPEFDPEDFSEWGEEDEIAFTPDEQFLEATEPEHVMDAAPTPADRAGRCHYCLKPLDDHRGWTRGEWPYMQFQPKLICESWKPTTEGA